MQTLVKRPSTLWRSLFVLGSLITALVAKAAVSDSAPVFGAQPQSQEAGIGQTVTFSAAATGSDPISYQWQWNGTNLPNATATNLVLANVQLTDSGSYSLIASNAFGTATSQPATLTVGAPPYLKTQPQSQTVLAGTTVTLWVTAGGRSPFSYQWLRNGTNIEGAASDKLIFTSAQPEVSGDYLVIVSSAFGVATSQVAAVRVGIPPTLAPLGDNLTPVVGQSVTLAPVAQGTEPLKWQWQLNGTNIPGANSPTLVLNNLQFTNSGLYSAVVSNLFGVVNTSNSVWVSVGAMSLGEALDATNFSWRTFGSKPWAVQTDNSSDGFAAANGDAWLETTVIGPGKVAFLWRISGQGSTYGTPDLIRFLINGEDKQELQGQFYLGNLDFKSGLAMESGWRLCTYDLPEGENVLQWNTQYLQWNRQNGNTGSVDQVTFTLQGTGTGPKLFGQPAEQMVYPGGYVKLSVEAQGTQPMQYSWYRGDTLVSCMGSDLILTNVAPEDEGYYKCVVSNAFGFVASSPSYLTVVPISPGSALDAPGLSWSVSGYDFYSNLVSSAASESWYGETNLSFDGVSALRTSRFTDSIWTKRVETTVVGPGIVTFWAAGVGRSYGFDGGDTLSVSVGGANNEQLALNAGWRQYSVSVPSGTQKLAWSFVRKEFGTTTGRYNQIYAALDQVIWSPGVAVAIASQPQDISVTAGATAVFKVTASGSGPISYQWRFNGVDIPGATGQELSIYNVQSKDVGGYSVVVKNTYASVESTTASLALAFPPSLTLQPHDQIVTVGNSVTFNVAAEGSEPMNYQWQFNGTDLPGATGTNLVLANVQTGDAGVYSVVVSNAGGITNSAPATLTVGVAPSLQVQPQSQTIGVGKTATFSVVAVGSEPLAYQWFFNGTTMVGATSPELVLNNVQLTQAGSYSVQVSNPFGSVTSQSAVATVQAGPTLSIQSQDVRAKVGDSVAFNATATGAEPLSYQWQFNGTNIVGATSASLNLTSVQLSDAGTYTLEVTDALGNESSVSATLAFGLTVQIVGSGTVFPDYNGQWLVEGQTYTITAKPATGCQFVQWTGAVVTNSAVLRFAFHSNECFVANFKDPVKPTISIVSPSDRARVTDQAVVVQGKAGDNAGISRVEYRVNGQAFTEATTTNGWKNWSARFDATAGTNRFEVAAVDANGNRSIVLTRTYTLVVNDALTVLTNGNGAVTPNLNGRALEIGKSYTMKAVPAKGYLFAGWNNGTQTPSLTFQMQSNLVVEARFVTNRFPGTKGTYSGVFLGDKVERESSGLVKLTVTDQGTFSGTVVSGATNSVTGKFGVDGSAQVKIARKGQSQLTLVLQLDLTGDSDQIQGTVTDGTWISALVCDRAVFNSTTRHAPQSEHRYTLAFAGLTEAGDGYGTVTVDPSGTIHFAGKLADGTAVSQSVGISKDGRWPLYLNLYGGKGVLSGWLTFTNREASSIEGTATWIDSRHALTNSVDVIGSKFTAPQKGQPVLTLTAPEIILSGGSFASPTTNTVSVTVRSSGTSITGTNGVNLTVSPSSGLVTGRFVCPETSATVSVYGVVLQQEGTLRGFFLCTGKPGAVLVREP